MSGQTLSKPNLEVQHRGWLTAAIMLATIMQVLDTTIANVALPHMAASLGASQEEINWVLTSYIVASAIATPMTGWTVDRLGRRNLFAIAIAGFMVSSLLCGVATGLEEMILFRVAQGIFGAVLVPLAQTVILDINPRERIGQAMAIYGAGIMVGPIIGPTLGGWLTEYFNWRYVFLINLPVGALALTGVLIFLPNGQPRVRRFDFFGFAMLALAVGALQLLLDRGQAVDWFNAPEIWLYTGLAIAGLWVFAIHCWTADDPFVDLRMFRDRNFSMGLVFIFIIGMTLFSGLALLPPLLQGLMGYPVMTTGLVMAPRGMGTMLSMVLVGRLVSRFDARGLVLFGLGATALASWMMTGFDTMMDDRLVIWSGVVQGFGLGFVFVPLSTLTFATLDARYRGDATAFFSLVRNVGSGVGISIVTTVLARMVSVNHEELAARLTIDSPQVHLQAPGLLSGNPAYVRILDGLVSQQAAMLAYLDNFFLMLLLTLAAVPIVFFLRSPKAAGGPAPQMPPGEH
ncbi:MAG: DHA2 family efflux MFS transporter permease subunit [Rhodobacter sp.]|uniref:DHA2 family efflux MFS transporter permease subunit n=1 Tax=Pararhodobacter sp. TaxID=2127056 RepID=UPI002CF4CBCB|nr:DHA2 family efflux MFS transporter permease subunit [Pararhodobacter sp.]MCC0072300.1 DHA2 family efflux MFS transporter permease subunit [Rhodobacter sp.]HPD92186.1 DHA2 family efflux MFS transporter permease subunit [Pararhodobacter sp.]